MLNVQIIFLVEHNQCCSHTAEHPASGRGQVAMLLLRLLFLLLLVALLFLLLLLLLPLILFMLLLQRDMTRSRIETQFQLKLSWYDSRLSFRGLKEEEYQNWVTRDENIWKPKLR